MRKNVKKQLALRVLSTAALVAMVSSIATAAFADTYDLNKGSVDILAEGGKQYITQWKDESKSTYATDDNGEIKKRQDDDITLTTKNKDTGKTETAHNTVTIDAKEGNTANVTLQDVNIEVDTTKAKSGAIEIKGDGNTNLELNGDNTVLVTNQWFGDEHAAIEKADTYGKEGTLTIKDDVNDNGKPKTGTEADTTGKLLAGGFHGTAAIGGGNGDRYSGEDSLADTSNITITGGKITAIAGNDGGAGIGGGNNGTGKNICIKGNADVTAASQDGAAIGGGLGSGNSVTITDDAVVNAYSASAAAIGNGGQVGRPNDPTTITISGKATVHAETSQRGCAIGTSGDGSLSDLTINIEKNANVTAIASPDNPAIGNAGCHGDTTTTINITGGTVNAINSFGSDNPKYSSQYDGTGDTGPAIGGMIHSWNVDGDHTATCNVNINSSTGDTIVNAYIYGKGSGPAIGSTTETDSYNPYKVEYQYAPADSASYKADGSSHFGEINSAIVNCYNNGIVNNGIVADENKKLNLPSTKDSAALNNVSSYRHEITGGTLTKVVHNRKYMDENPKIDTSDLKDEDLHDWQLVGKVVEPTTEKDGYADYICSIDKCGQTKHVVLPKLTPEPSEPDTPNKPDTPDTPDTPSTPDVPSTPEVTPADPAVTPDAPAQDGTAPADTPAADTTAAAQNVAQNAEPKAAAAPAALPQTGANWLAVVGSALSGLFLLAAGFVLDRKNRRMN